MEKLPTKGDKMDRAPRYAPDKVLILGHGQVPVQTYKAYPPGQHPEGCPLVKECTALELKTAHGSRWWGFERVWINSELRMVVSGFSCKDEVRSKWQKAGEL